MTAATLDATELFRFNWRLNESGTQFSPGRAVNGAVPVSSYTEGGMEDPTPHPGWRHSVWTDSGVPRRAESALCAQKMDIFI